MIRLLSQRHNLCCRHEVSKCWCFVDFTWILGLVGDDAADKVRLSAAEVSHHFIKILLQVTTHKQTELKTFCMLHRDNVSVSMSQFRLSCTNCPSQVTATVWLTLCNCETVWKEAAFLFLCLVSAFRSPAETTAQKTFRVHYMQNTHLFFFVHSSMCRSGVCSFVSVSLCSYPSQSWCSSQTVQPSVCWKISGTELPPSHSEDLCSYPASLWCCTAPTGKRTQWALELWLHSFFPVTLVLDLTLTRDSDLLDWVFLVLITTLSLVINWGYRSALCNWIYLIASIYFISSFLIGNQ